MKINWLGIISSIGIIILLITQVTHPPPPWWSLTAGKEETYMVKADVSPFLVDVVVLGLPLESPILTYVTLSATLMFIATAITMMMGSVFVEKPWSKYLIEFAYLKPVLTLIFFVGLLFAVSGFAGSSFKSEIPLMGDVDINFHYEDTHILLQTRIPIHTTFSWTFLFAFGIATLIIAAKIYQDKLCKDLRTQE